LACRVHCCIIYERTRNKIELIFKGGDDLKALIFCATAILLLLALIGEAHANAVFSCYNDKACTVPTASVDWGNNLTPGQNITRDIYVRNDGGESFTGFFVAMSDVAPSNATDYLQLGLNVTSSEAALLPLKPQEVIMLPLTLMIASDALPGVFSFNIILSGTAGTASGSTGGSGGGGYSRTIPMATTAPAASGTGNLTGLFFLVVVGVAALLLLGKKR
jgi:hypothetical protein